MDEIAKSFLNKNPEFGNEDSLKKIGSGYNGSVFLTDKNLVVKVTKDKEEFDTSVQIFNKANGKYTPTYHKLDRIGDNYIIVMDKIDPINLTGQQNVFLNLFRDKMLDMIDSGIDITPLKGHLETIDDPKLKFVLSGLIDAASGLKNIGITNADIHEDNIGVNNGKIVLIDVVDKELVQEVKRVKGIIKELIKEFLGYE